jgi:hypothetical protein
MSKYHINPITGQPGKCTASKKPCRFGKADKHFNTRAEAQESYEKSQETQQFLDGLRKDPSVVEFTEVPASKLMHPKQKAHIVGKYLVSTRPVGSISAKGGVETLYETMVIDNEDKDGDGEVESWATRDPDPEVHKKQHSDALAYTFDLVSKENNS